MLALNMCQAPIGPDQPSQEAPTPASIPKIRKFYTTVTKQHYPPSHPGYAVIVLDDPDVSSTTDIVSVSYLNIYNRWARVLWLHVSIMGVQSVQTDVVEGRKDAFAVMLIDRYQKLLSRQIRVRYAP
ncbi:MAG: hypothetical protein JSW54_00290 [Fidelibacterota bacterium]|nr:MAG: hypothetical protein JSW54_00290 [Candidatus Neomarinimicrobiota bacterium]